MNPLSFFFVAAVIVVWGAVPFVAFSVFAGLTQVPDEVLEAAAIDGANGWQRFWGITLPIVRPVLAIVLLLQLVWDLRVFAQIKLLQDAGGTPSETNLLGTYIYQLGIGSGDFGTSSAVSIFVLVLTIALSWGYVRTLIREDECMSSSAHHHRSDGRRRGLTGSRPAHRGHVATASDLGPVGRSAWSESASRSPGSSPSTS